MRISIGSGTPPPQGPNFQKAAQDLRRGIDDFSDGIERIKRYENYTEQDLTFLATSINDLNMTIQKNWGI